MQRESKNNLSIFVIGIAGGVATGKTTFSNMLSEYLQKKGIGCSIINMDSYYKNLRYIV